jgi:hypothetical protein
MQKFHDICSRTYKTLIIMEHMLHAHVLHCQGCNLIEDHARSTAIVQFVVPSLATVASKPLLQLGHGCEPGGYLLGSAMQAFRMAVYSV